MTSDGDSNYNSLNIGFKLFCLIHIFEIELQRHVNVKRFDWYLIT